MRREKYKDYIASGVTAFLVLAATLLFAFALEHIQIIREGFSNICMVLRPVFYGMVMAFLLLPIHRYVRSFMESLISPEGLKKGKISGFVNLVAILVSMAFAAAMIYLLLAMVLPQVYLPFSQFFFSKS